MNIPSSTPAHHEVPKPLVRFVPPLQEQRQVFLLNVLRNEDPRSVLDLGCGEGSLLAAMCQPGLALSCRPDFDEKYGISPEASVQSVADKYPAINIKRIHGLDISENCLREANERVKPPQGMLSPCIPMLTSLILTKMTRVGQSGHNPAHDGWKVPSRYGKAVWKASTAALGAST